MESSGQRFALAIFANPDKLPAAMPSRNINLTEHRDRFVKAEIGSGRYGNASEVVRESLRLLERRKREEQTKLRWLRGAVRQGLDEIDRGQGEEFASMDRLDEMIEQIGQEASAAVIRKRGRV